MSVERVRATTFLADQPKPELPHGADKTHLACKQCRLVLSASQFLTHGCPYCSEGTADEGVAWTKEELDENTTTNYGGFVGVIDAETSWVARLIGKGDARIGIYAGMMHPEDEDEEDDFDEDEEGEGDPYAEAAAAEPEWAAEGELHERRKASKRSRKGDSVAAPVDAEDLLAPEAPIDDADVEARFAALIAEGKEAAEGEEEATPSFPE